MNPLGSTTLWLWHMRCSVNHINNPDLFAPPPLKMSIASERPDFVRPNDALTTSLPTHHYHQLHPANLTHYRICIPPSFSRLAPSSTFVIPATPHINHTPQANRNEYAPTLINRDGRLLPPRRPRTKVPHVRLYPSGAEGEDDLFRMLEVGVSCHVVHSAL